MVIYKGNTGRNVLTGEKTHFRERVDAQKVNSVDSKLSMSQPQLKFTDAYKNNVFLKQVNFGGSSFLGVLIWAWIYIRGLPFEVFCGNLLLRIVNMARYNLATVLSDKGGLFCGNSLKAGDVLSGITIKNNIYKRNQ